MRILLIVVLLIAVIGGGAYFYVTTLDPMLADYKRMKEGMPELDRAKAELKKYKEKETKETAWIKPAVEALNAGLSDEIKTGKAEVTQAGTAIVVNISEDIMYTPRSMTFAKDSPQLRLKLATLLGSKELKGKQITVGNTTDAVAAQGKGRKKILPREARALAADRSVALAKYLEQNKVDKETLVAAAYDAKIPDPGFRIKDRKTIIVIENPPAPSGIAQPKPAPAPGAQPAPKSIPLKPAQPKGQ